MLLAPLRKEVGQRIVDGFGHHDADRHELITDVAVGAVAHTLALEAENTSRTDALRNLQRHAARHRVGIDLAGEHGFVDRDRQVEEDVVAETFEFRMRSDVDLDERIAVIA